MFRDYLLSFRAQWFTLMTGALTIPLTVLAFYLDSVLQRIVFAVFAVLCAGIATYRTWAVERSEVLRLQALVVSAAPRIILGFEPDRGYNAFANDPSFRHEPFFLRNDGGDTALNLRVPNTSVAGRQVSFSLTSNHVVPRGSLGLHIYSGNDRVDQHIDRMFIELLDEAARSGARGAIELQLAVSIEFEDRHRKYETVFHITCGAQPRPAGGFQMQPVAVELQRVVKSDERG